MMPFSVPFGTSYGRSYGRTPGTSTLDSTLLSAPAVFPEDVHTTRATLFSSGLVLP